MVLGFFPCLLVMWNICPYFNYHINPLKENIFICFPHRFFDLFYIYDCFVQIYVCAPHVCLVHMDIELPSCELPCRRWGLNLGPRASVPLSDPLSCFDCVAFALFIGWQEHLYDSVVLRYNSETSLNTNGSFLRYCLVSDLKNVHM